MEGVWIGVLNRSVSAGWLVLAVMLSRLLLRRAPKRISVLLWGLVGVRLMMPVPIKAGFSLIPSGEVVSPSIGYARTPAIHSGISVLDRAVNPALGSSLAAAPSDSVNPMQVWLFVLSAIWIAGIALLLLDSLLRLLRLRGRVAGSVLLRENIWLCDQIDAPFLLGVFRPRIYLPSGLPEAQRGYVLAHERAHLERGDHLWKLAGFLLLTVYWFHPLLWAAYLLLCRDIELACDEKVISQMDLPEKKAYAHTLVSCSTRRRLVPACPLAFGEVGVKERVKGVLSYRKPTLWIVLAAAALCALLAACFLTDPVGELTGNYFLTIGAEGVKSVEVTTPYTSGGCQNADGSLFRKGERVWLEPLEGLQDLRGVTVSALDEAGEVLWTASIPADADNRGFTRLTQDGWTITDLEQSAAGA